MSEVSYRESAAIPRKAVVAGIIVEQGNILVVHNIKHGLRIEPPGGKLEFGETMEEAVVRELSEELGITVSILSKIGVYPTDVTKEGVFDVHTFLCEIVEGKPTDGLEAEKTGGFAWMTIDELEACPALVQSMRAALPAVRALPHFT